MSCLGTWTVLLAACRAEVLDNTAPGMEPVALAAPPVVGAEVAPPSSLSAVCIPLSNVLRFDCTVTVDPPQPVQVRFSKVDGTGLERVHQSDAVAAVHTVRLYFLESRVDYTVEVSATAWPGDPVVATTIRPEAPPTDVRSALLVAGTSSVPMIGTHQPCNTDAIAVVYSTLTGKLVWYQKLDPVGTFSFNDMVQFTEDHTVLGETTESLVEVDLEGVDVLRLVNGVHYDDYLHHDIFKRDGRYFLLSKELGDSETTLMLDEFIVLDGQGQEIARWRGADHLTVPEDAVGNWMHVNSIYVDDEGDVLLSSWEQSSIFKVEGDTSSNTFGTVLWTLAGRPDGELGQDFVVDWSVVDGLDTFVHQHGAHLRHDGRLMFLDNHHGRGLVVTVDEVGMTATVDEEWPTTETLCDAQGTARDSSVGNAFVGCSSGDMSEFDPSGNLVWSAEVDCSDDDARVTVARFYPLEGW